MDSLTDPPPDEHYTRPNRAVYFLRQRGRGFWFLLLLTLVILGLIVPFRPHSHPGQGSRAEAISNIKIIGLALFTFEDAYDRYPDDVTIEAVKKTTHTLLPLGTKSSNDYFRQLFATECIDSEKYFYARLREHSRKPDNLMDGNHALEQGECAFSYIIGPDSSGRPPKPLVVTPLIPGTDRFDPKPFAGKAVIYRTDCSATVEPIDKHGHVLDASGNNLLDPANPLWAGKPPRIVWPE